MIDTTKKLNIISLEELKGEIKKEEKETNSENFFIESNKNENYSSENISDKKESFSSEKINSKKSFVENKKKENIEKIEFKKNIEKKYSEDLKQINRKENTKNIESKIEKTKNKEKIYINIQEASKISGISNKTIRKSLKSNELSYFFENGKYSLELENFLKWIFQSPRKTNMMNTKGIGRFIETWKIF